MNVDPESGPIEVAAAPAPIEAGMAPALEVAVDDGELAEAMVEEQQAGDEQMDVDGSTAPVAQNEDDDTAPRPEALTLLGVNELSTKDISSYATHFFADEPPRLEWVDDSSIVLVYGNGETAQRALSALTAEAEFYDGEPEALAVRTAKPHHVKPEANLLQIRAARNNDRKVRGARDRSRYYLLYGDPRDSEPRSRRRVDYADDSDDEYHRRRDDDRRAALEDNALYGRIGRRGRDSYEPSRRSSRGTDRYVPDVDSSRRLFSYGSENVDDGLVREYVSNHTRRRSVSPLRRDRYDDRDRSRSRDRRDRDRDRDHRDRDRDRDQNRDRDRSRDRWPRDTRGTSRERSFGDRLDRRDRSRDRDRSDLSSRLNPKEDDKQGRRRAHHLFD
ncbi:uncharacterized protein V1510DRAFT_131733 [Dipodascopsis tothii]|uniref:uncharacterized protein n=1 Tax=Dipodascopsis tothii TaxID=44089 RepID=UPI0034CDF2D5